MESNYSNYMKTIELRIARVGNSGVVRLPAATLRRHHISSAVLMEERSDAIILRPTGTVAEKLSWENTAREMAASMEDWRAWDATSADGMESVPWDDGRRKVAEQAARYTTKPLAKRSRRSGAS